MARVNRLLSRLLSARTRNNPRRSPWRPSFLLLEDRLAPATLIQVANADGYVADTNQDGVFDTVNTTGPSVQTSSIPAANPVTDQSCVAPAYYNYNTSYSGNLALGQEFKPTQSSVSFVDLVIADAGSDIGPGANFLVKIHAGTIGGTVLGTSATAFVPDNTNITGTTNYTHFTFASPVAVTPGSTYVVEVVQTGSIVPGNSNFMLTADNPNGADVYTGGRAIIHGTPVTTNMDFLFREGSAGQAGVTERGVMEFSTAGVTASSTIGSAMLTGTINTLQNGTPAAIGVSFYAYAGSGQITTADATASGVLVGSLSAPSPGAFSLNLNAGAIQSLTQSPSYTGYLGILMLLTNGQRIFLNSTNSTAAGPQPTLQIVYDTTNQPPVATNDSYRVNAGGGTLNVAAPGVLGNDRDPNGDPLTASLVTGPSSGSLVFNADGSFSYTPGANFSGDSFTYQASDGSAYSNIAKVSLSVDRAPVAYNYSTYTLVNTPLNLAAPGILANDSDPDGDPITTLLVSGPSHGSLTLNGDGSFNYVPAQDYTGPDSFTYQASDGTLTSNTATVNLYVDTLPVAQDDSYSVNAGSVLSVAAPGVLANDSDVNGNALRAYLVTSTAHGSLSWSGDGSFRYTPASGFIGTDSFTYKASDGYGFSNVATVTITVNTTDHPPVAVNDSYTTIENQTLTLAPVPGVTSLVMQSQAGDYIGQGLNYSYSSATGVFSASRNYDNGVSLSYQDSTNANAWWYLDFAAPGNAYLTPGNYLNATRYPFQSSNVPGLDVSGEGRGSNTLTGQFTVVQAVYGPGSQIDRFDATFVQHSEGATPALTGEIKYNSTTAPSGVLLNDSDPDGDPLTAVLVTGPAHGTLTLNADGSFTYTPSANFVGVDSFTYRASDGTLTSNVATVSITVNDPTPVLAVSGASSVNEGSTYTLNLSGSDADPITGWTITWGDGNVQNVTGNPTAVTHVYADGPNAYTASATATTEDGTFSAGNTVSVSVLNVPPTLTLSGPASANEQSLYTLNLSSSDPGQDTISSWTITWGDGATQTVNGNPSSVSHVYAHGAYTISATATDEDGTYSAGNTVAVNVSAVHFAVTGAGTATAGASFGLTVTALDPSGNPATGYLGTVHFTDTDPLGTVPADYTFGSADAGSHAFANAFTLDTAGTQTITAADTVLGSIAGGAPISVSPAAANRFVVSVPATATAGVPVTVSVTAFDVFNNVATGYAGTVHFTSSDTQATLPADATLTAGRGSFSVTLDTAGAQTVSATDTANGSLTASGTVAVSPAAATHFRVSAPATATAGMSVTVSVTALDAFGNVATGYAGTVHFTSSDGQATLPADATLTAGRGSFSVTLDTAGAQTVSATDTAATGVTGSTSTSVSPAAATHFRVSAPATATAGVAFTVAVTALDAFGNVATGYAGTVHFTSSDGQATLPADATLAAGTGSFSVTLDTAGAQTVSATDTANGSLAASGTVAVSPAAATHFRVSAPATATAGMSVTVSVTALDAFGNVATGYAGTVHFTSSDGQATLPADATLTAGRGSFSVTLDTAGAQTVSATDTAATGVTGSTSTSVSPAAAVNLAITGFPTATTAGVAQPLTVTLRDAFGNVATGYTGTVRFTSSDVQAGLPATYTFTAADAGVKTFNVALKTAGTQSIAATDVANSALTATRTGITVTPAAAVSFTVAGFPATTAGVAHTFTVTAHDAYGNVAVGYTGTVHFTSNDTQASLPADYTFTAADAGVHAFTATLKNAGTRSITATDRSNAALVGSETGINVVAAAATHFALSAPSDVNSQAQFTVVVTALDAFGNVATGYRGHVHFTSSDRHANLPGDYTFTSADAGVHSFTATLRTRGLQSITVKDTAQGSITGTTNVQVH